MKKKLTCMLLSCVMPWSLCGCNEAPPVEGGTTAAEIATEAAWSLGIVETLFEPTLPELSKHSDCVIEGTIQTAEIVVMGMSTWDVLEISVTECRYGSISKGDIISVYTMHNLDRVPAPAVGESYLCFLADADDSHPEGTYEAVIGHARSFFVREEDTYSNPYTEVEFALADLEAALQEKPY